MYTRPKSASDIQMNGDNNGSKFKLGRLSYYEYKSERSCRNRRGSLKRENNGKACGDSFDDVSQSEQLLSNHSGAASDMSEYDTDSVWIENTNGKCTDSSSVQCHACKDKTSGAANGTDNLTLQNDNTVLLSDRQTISRSKETVSAQLKESVDSNSKTLVNQSDKYKDNHKDASVRYDTNEEDILNHSSGMSKEAICNSGTNTSSDNLMKMKEKEENDEHPDMQNVTQSSTCQNFDVYLSEEETSSTGVVNAAAETVDYETDATGADEIDDKVASRIDIHKLRKTNSGPKPPEKRKESFEQRLKRRFTIKDEHTSEVTKRIIATVVKYALFVFNFCSWVSELILILVNTSKYA